MCTVEALWPLLLLSLAKHIKVCFRLQHISWPWTDVIRIKWAKMSYVYFSCWPIHLISTHLPNGYNYFPSEHQYMWDLYWYIVFRLLFYYYWFNDIKSLVFLVTGNLNAKMIFWYFEGNIINKSKIDGWILNTFNTLIHYRHGLYINIKTKRGSKRISFLTDLYVNMVDLKKSSLQSFCSVHVAGVIVLWFILPGPWPCLPKQIMGHPFLADVISWPLIFYSCSHWIVLEVQTSYGLCTFMGLYSLLSLQPVMEQQAWPCWRICTISVLILIHRPLW